MKPASNMNVSAVILAAGFSSRMKKFKPLLSFGGKTMVEKAIELFKENRIPDIVVVTGHNSELLEPVVEKTGAIPVFNPDFKSGMLSSIQKGIKNIGSENHGFFLLPVDIPAIRPSTINLMIRQFQKTRDHVIIPYFDDKPGHPPLIPFGLKTDILDLKNDSTLRDVLWSRDNRITPLKVHDRGILMDADDEKGYEQVCQKILSLHIPDKKECFSIINEALPDKDGIRAHLTDVSFVALKIVTALSCELNADLVLAGALLHDILRTEPNHAQAGANLLLHLGFSEVSKIVAQHMDITLDLTSPVREKELVYFADKICSEQGIDLDYHKRFKDHLTKSPWAGINISRRYEHTKLIQARIEAAAGKSIKEILSG
ncbi:MAG: NTP transferase domain-containing protein [Desulfobacula sp.]|uniref:DVU_1551 family NTP transferase n=1 Tax=Desulfobacula sp. TaxID=2593537 RepID=UPI001EC86BC0|nr:NTP transferase domain-containing protein [Desulfobacula sp.]